MELGPEWPYRIVIEQEDWPSVQVWCETYIGFFERDWYKLGIDPAQFGSVQTVWFFKRYSDAVLFKLKWA